MSRSQMPRQSQSLLVYPAEQFTVVNGANLGDALSVAEDLVPDDIYRLSPAAWAKRLSVVSTPSLPFHIGSDGDLGTPGADLHLDCCVTFMSGDGETSECLVMVETDAEGGIVATYMLPLAPLDPRTDYALVGVDTQSAVQKFGQIGCVSFTRGTRITLSTGAQKRVEDLQVGDRVLTRDDGPQEIRWVGHTTTRAVGSFAPILIKQGTLNNMNDLVVSPDHRLFIYQRTDRLGAGRSELLVKARHLVNGTTVQRLSGGYVEYYQMLFDTHQIIYAEGIAAESMLVNTQTRAALPAEVAKRVAEVMPGHDPSFDEIEVQEGLLNRPDAAELLRQSSGG